MAYSELIKSFARVRDYVNQFYVYGFKTRQEYTQKSARSYDNERRRIESWLGDYMSFNQASNGKNVFLSVDSRAVSQNPLYRAFKAKSFTDNDITLHFYILDILNDREKHSLSDIVNTITDKYLSFFDDERIFDESTIRKKLVEYVKLGIIEKSRQGKALYYTLATDNINLNAWRDAIAFFSEADELGVIGSYLLDKLDGVPEYYSFKHHYILHALESEMLYSILIAISEHKKISIESYSARRRDISHLEVLPLKIYVSTHTGRRHLLCHKYNAGFLSLRLDGIKKIAIGDVEEYYDTYLKKYNDFSTKLWGVSFNKTSRTDHVEMLVYVGDDEAYIIKRLEREKRCGTVTKIDTNHYLFSADIYDAAEMLPWLRSFIGRIERLDCSNKKVIEIFNEDLKAMKELYGGDCYDIQ